MKSEKLFCSYCRRRCEVVGQRCQGCGYPVSCTPLGNITTEESLFDPAREDFVKTCCGRFFEIYHEPIIRYILRSRGLSWDHREWAEEIASEVHRKMMHGKIVLPDGNIKFRHALMNKIQDIIKKDYNKKKREREKLPIVELQETLDIPAVENEELQNLFCRDVLEVTYQKIVESDAGNKYTLELFRYIEQHGDFPDNQFLRDKWGLTPENARKQMSRFRELCRVYLLDHLALGREARREELKKFSQANW